MNEPIDEVVNGPTASYINAFALRVNKWANGHGFWTFVGPSCTEGDATPIHPNHYLVKATKHALMHTEVSEGVEGLRKKAESSIPQGNEAEEMADTVIRIMDYCAQYNLNLGGAIVAKQLINEQRPYKHGKAF